MKKLVLFFVAAVAVSFAACGNKTAEEATTQDSVQNVTPEVISEVVDSASNVATEVIADPQ